MTENQTSSDSAWPQSLIDLLEPGRGRVARLSYEHVESRQKRESPDGQSGAELPNDREVAGGEFPLVFGDVTTRGEGFVIGHQPGQEPRVPDPIEGGHLDMLEEDSLPVSLEHPQALADRRRDLHVVEDAEAHHDVEVFRRVVRLLSHLNREVRPVVEPILVRESAGNARQFSYHAPASATADES